MKRSRGFQVLLPSLIAFASLRGGAPAALADQPGVDPIADPAFYQLRPDWDPSAHSRGYLIDYEPETEMQPGVFAMVDTYRIMYQTENARGEPAAATGYVFIHKTAPAPADGWDIVAWAHGTSGQGDDCAPSKYDDLWPEWPWLDYGKVAANLVYAGFLAVAPDYDGLGIPGIPSYIPSYIHGPAMASAVIDSVKAARQLAADLGQQTSGDWAVIGHSQGAIAARATNVSATPANAPGLTFRGSVEMAGPVAGYEDALQLLEDLAGMPVPAFPIVGYVAASIRAVHPSFDYDNLVGPVMSAHMSEAETACGDTWNETIWGSLPQPALHDVINPSYRADPDVKNWALAAAFGSNGVGSQGPALIINAQYDEYFSTARQQAARAYLCAGGGTVASFITYNGLSHDTLLKRGVADGIAWLIDRFNGAPATDECP